MCTLRSWRNATFRLCFCFGLLSLLISNSISHGQQPFLGTSALETSSASNFQEDSTRIFELGLKLEKEKRHAEAGSLFLQAIKAGYQPVAIAYRKYLGNFKAIGKLIFAFTTVAESFLNQGDYNSAKNVLEQALKVQTTDNEQDFVQTAKLYSLMGKVDKDNEISHLLRAVSLHPKEPEYQFDLGRAYFENRQWKKALDAFERAYSLDRDHKRALGNIAYLETRVAIWDNYDERMEEIETLLIETSVKFSEKYKSMNLAKVEEGNALIKVLLEGLYLEPHMTLSMPFSLETKHAVAMQTAVVDQYRALHMTGLQPFKHNHEEYKNAKRRIRLGYVSADFRLKATSYLLRYFFRYHDPTVFEVFVFAVQKDSDEWLKTTIGSDWRKDIADSVEHFVDITDLDPLERVSMLSGRYKMDILVNMDGYSNNGIRDQVIFQLQCAPVQVSMLVYVGTLGADYVQYLVTDPVASPIEYEQQYSEKFIYLPQSFFVNSHADFAEFTRPVYRTPMTFAELTRPFTFCNFNKHLKLTPNVFKLWIQIFTTLIRDHDLRVSLILLEYPKESTPNIERFISKQNIPELMDASVFQISFLPFVANPYEHQRRIGNLCDAVLDSAIYNAHTMAVDTLWGGTPLVVFGNGIDMGGRVGCSILTELRIPELIAYNDQEYVEIGVRLATNESFYSSIQTRLVKSADPSQLNRFWNTKRYVRNLEKGLLEAWNNFITGNEPVHVNVQESDTDNATCAV